MKKAWSGVRVLLCLLLCFALAFPLTGCSLGDFLKDESNASEDREKDRDKNTDKGQDKEEDDSAKPDSTEETSGGVEAIPEQTQPPELPEESRSEIRELTMHPDDQYRINIFLSTFSEQWFHEFYEWNPETNEAILISDRFETRTADVSELEDFAWIYAKINLHAVEILTYEGHYYYGVDCAQIDSIVKRFFDRSITSADIPRGEMTEEIGYETIVVNGMVCHPAADGDSYNNMTVATNMYDLGDGTIQVDFVIYYVSDTDSFGGGPGAVLDSSVYHFTYDQAQAQRAFEYHLSGIAVVKPFTTDAGVSSYQLVSYELFP